MSAQFNLREEERASKLKTIIIPCSGKKLSGGNAEYRSPQLASILGDVDFHKLLVLRKELSELMDLPPGPDIGSAIAEPSLKYRPAFDRYDGKMYQTAEFRLIFPGFRGRVLIVSALYGLLDANDHIRDYNLAMKDALLTRERVWNWWRRNGLGAFVEKALNKIETTEVHDLLSSDYRKAIGCPESNSKYQIKEYCYPGQGTGSLYRRGEDLKKILLV